uniref:Uncharacterized protein n=1 Tax=Anguilla anguilla TaxID=7936 RepID=A0A0E9R7G6_ANGAN
MQLHHSHFAEPLIQNINAIFFFYIFNLYPKYS